MIRPSAHRRYQLVHGRATIARAPAGPTRLCPSFLPSRHHHTIFARPMWQHHEVTRTSRAILIPPSKSRFRSPPELRNLDPFSAGEELHLPFPRPPRSPRIRILPSHPPTATTFPDSLMPRNRLPLPKTYLPPLIHPRRMPTRRVILEVHIFNSHWQRHPHPCKSKRWRKN